MDVLSAAWTLVAAGVVYRLVHRLGACAVRGGRGTDEALVRLAAALDVRVACGWGGDRVLEGEIDGFPVTLRVERHGPMFARAGDHRASLLVTASVDGRRKIPAVLRLVGGESPRAILFRETWGRIGWPVRTEDTAFDRQILVGALAEEERAVYSLLDSSTRLALRCAADRGGVRVDGGFVECVFDLSEAKALAGEARLALDALIDLVRALCQPMSEREIERRLKRSAIEDPIAGFRIQCIESMLARSPRSEATKAALDAALASRSPALQLIGALHLDSDSARRALGDLAAADEAPDGIRSRAILELAATDPLGHREIFAHALGAKSPEVQAAAVNGLGQLELCLLPIDRIVEMAYESSDAVFEPLIPLLDRARGEEAENLDESAVAKMLEALAHLTDQGVQTRRGRLSLAASGADEGALSVSEPPEGRVSVARTCPDQAGESEKSS
jgi:hypothetical protein